MQGTPKISFNHFIATAFENGLYSTDDVVSFILPLFEQVLELHETGLVAPFEKEETLFVSNNTLYIDTKQAHAPVLALEKIKLLFAKNEALHFEVTNLVKTNDNLDKGTKSTENLQIHLDIDKPLKYTAYLLGYQSYEHLLGHHDALTDIFCLGLLLASIALGIDLHNEKDLKAFAQHGATPLQINPKIHPAIASLITEMTELDRQKRSADLYDIILRLKHYRDYNPEKQADLSNLSGWINKDLSGRSQYILNKLRNRLFDTSRRNRLLYYKPNVRFVNLTVSSMPMVLHYQSIRPELLFTWNEEIADKVVGMKEILLNKYLRFEDHAYLPSSLEKIRSENKKNIQEYGFSQLKIVIAFLNWHNLKDEKEERIQSPLLLVPTELKKNKKLNEDHYICSIEDNQAEVNPILANVLKDLYGIQLPDFIDLDEMSVAEFYDVLKAQIAGANQGISLSLIDKPRIKLTYTVAVQTIVSYKKKMLKKGNQQGSLQRKPIFEFVADDDTVDTAANTTNGKVITDKSQSIELTDSESNPYSWDFDTCNMVLGNFNYKQMSLVRDYNQIIDRQIEHKVFEQLFSTQPRQQSEAVHDLNKPEEWQHIITADPTQTKAILQSRTGESYIIQGPPGTGKSQTITNLIADFLARGKSILFVCEKRAALDVVYHRLKQQGLDELCCYIHDSQSDKRSFVKDLKTTYEDFTARRMDLTGIEVKRKAILQTMHVQMEILHQFHSSNMDITIKNGISIRQLIERLIELKAHLQPISQQEEEVLPPYCDWLQFGEIIKDLGKALEETGAEDIFANHPFSKVKGSVFVAENPQNLLDKLTKSSIGLLGQINTIIQKEDIDPERASTITQIKNLVQYATLLEPLLVGNNLFLTDTTNPATKKFEKKIKTYRQQQKQHEQAKQQASNWKTKFGEQDTMQALTIATKQEGRFFSFLNGQWKSLKRQLDAVYDFSKHPVTPTYTQVLTLLQTEYQVANLVSQTKQELETDYQVDNIEMIYLSIERLRAKHGENEISYLTTHKNANALIAQLIKLSVVVYDAEKQLQQCLVGYNEKDIATIIDELESISSNTDALRDLLPSLRNFSQLPSLLKETVRHASLSPLQIEAAMANKAIGNTYRENKTFADIDIQALEKAAKEIQVCYTQLLNLNANHIRASVRKRFLTNVEISNTAVSQLNPDQKLFKKNYTEGRKIVENEFSKSMRFKSIRELAAKESGMVLKDIKPVWLMSPLSVSDSLPLDNNLFDIIIFDEASQITLEEGIPALYRAPQTIIVGDEKQMPPTNFFSAKAEDPDDMDFDVDEMDDEILSNDADSLLTQGAKKLSSVMLGWHYRSHYETLISYSNHAFYDAGLLTIPDKTIHHTAKSQIEVLGATDATSYADALFDRSMSYHYLPNSVYEHRNNQGEANYIAHLVRELLNRQTDESIGIVAFSQEQQNTIEDALATLAEKDKLFEQQLEEAYNKSIDNQFIGLFIKNLENVQGDERDIIIMSVCYGFDARKKMLMNFGPINKKGGENRLNVIFSRAKKHMAMVSSIKHHHITNEYNEGANYFKRFLQYAELVSNGDMEMAKTILTSLSINNKENISSNYTSIISSEIKAQLEGLGYSADMQIGQSDFKVSLAVKLNKEDEVYTLCVLIDNEEHYQSNNLLELYYQRPAILKTFGWKMIFVTAKDWLQEPKRVINLILKRLKEASSTEAETEKDEKSLFLAAKNTETTKYSQTQLFAQDEAEKAENTPYSHLSFTSIFFKDEKSHKFWEAAIDGAKLITRFGKAGTKGQTQIKTFATAALAEKEKAKLLADRIEKGYKYL
ncbi:AAA domain-containing protein [Parasediminibacterium sp. JCM 36343]|uniref:AAA domain-containing protein n=1 Tax=Parasediminibacterium sp. JCM 36343 TaxID=3374279 RepID=UPI00397E3330